jgi:N-acetylglutamate synthase-like GNAT family acetyltransferase
MGQQKLDLEFEEITEDDIPVLTEVMTRAFDDDAQKHLGKERGGPPGYDNGDFFREWLFGYEQTRGHKALTEGKVIGAVIVWILPNGDNVLGAIFVDPPYQDRGVGTQMWQFIEAKYPETKSWRLATPTCATKNYYFYETRCGFQRVESDTIVKPEEGMYVFRKDMGQASPAAAKE